MSDSLKIVDIKKDVSDSLIIHKNYEQEMIVTTIDKLRLCLMDNRHQSASLSAWMAPFGILVTLVGTLVATDFKDSLGMSRDWWQALFIFATGAVALWFLSTLVR